jgi:hypothetical protein
MTAVNFCFSNGSAHDASFFEGLIGNCTGSAMETAVTFSHFRVFAAASAVIAVERFGV